MYLRFDPQHRIKFELGEVEFDFTNPNICYGKGSGGGGTETVNNSTAPPPQVMAAYQTALNSAQSAASQPLQQYNAPTVAGFSPDQLSSFQQIAGAQGIANPYINSAQSAITAGTTPLWNNVQQFSPSAVQQYQSPYTSSVLNSTMAAEQNQDAQQQTALQGNAISSGAWGGDRAGVASAVLSGQQDIANNATNANIENTGYNTALGEFNTQQQAQLGANEANDYLQQQAAFGEAGLGTEAQSTALTGADAQEASGAIQQQLAQSQLNVPYEQYLQSQAYPFQTAQYYANIAEGIGSESGGTGTSATTTPAPSVGSQIAGFGLGGLGLAGGALSSRRGGRVGGLARGGRARGFAMGGVPDESVDFIPNTQGAMGPGPPKASTSSATRSVSNGSNGLSIGDLAGAGKGLKSLIGLFGGSGDLGALGGSSALDAGAGSALDMFGETNPLDIFGAAGDLGGEIGGDLAGSAVADAGLDAGADAAADFGIEDLIPAIFALKRGGSVGMGARQKLKGMGRHYDVGGATPMTSQLQGQQMPTQQSTVNNMTPEQIQALMMRMPIGSQQQRSLQQMLNQKRMMPNVGAQANNGLQPASSQPQQAPQQQMGLQGGLARGGKARRGFADGGDTGSGIQLNYPPPPDADQLQRALELGDLPGNVAADGANVQRVPLQDLAPPGSAPRMGAGPPQPLSAPPPAATTAREPAPQQVAQNTSDYSTEEPPNARTPSKPNPWLALAQAGFAMAGGTSPYAGVNIGRGAEAGLANYANQQKESDTVNDAADKLMAEAKQHKDTMALDQQRVDEETRHNRVVEGQGKWQKAVQPDGSEVFYNPVTQQTRSPQGNGGGGQSAPFIDPSTGEIVGSAATPAAGGQTPAFGFNVTSTPKDVRHQMTVEDSKLRQNYVTYRPIAENVNRILDNLEPNLSLVDTGGEGNPLYARAARTFNPTGTTATASADIEKDTNDLASELSKFQYVPGMRGSVLGLQTILASKPGMSQPPQTNENIVANLRAKTNSFLLESELAQRYREANPMRITDQNMFDLDDALKQKYPLEFIDSKTGNVTFNKDNIQKYRQAIPDAIANPRKYLDTTSNGQDTSAPQPDPMEGRTATGPKGAKMIMQGGKWVPYGQ